MVEQFDINVYKIFGQFISLPKELYVIANLIFDWNKNNESEAAFRSRSAPCHTVIAVDLRVRALSHRYTWSHASSIPLDYVSRLTLNIATLLLIKDSWNMIGETNRYNEDLVFVVIELEMELAENRVEISR